MSKIDEALQFSTLDLNAEPTRDAFMKAVRNLFEKRRVEEGLIVLPFSVVKMINMSWEWTPIEPSFEEKLEELEGEMEGEMEMISEFEWGLWEMSYLPTSAFEKELSDISVGAALPPHPGTGEEPSLEWKLWALDHGIDFHR